MLNWLINNSPLFYLTQSLWRDEAFSILVSQRPISGFFGKLSFEPPFYYMLLHFWMKIFGNSEIATRMLSFTGFALAVVLVIFWAEKLFRKSWLSFYLPVFFFFNPMLIYYAFEVRTYGWFIFFATLSVYAYMEKKWKLLTVSNILGFYTHSYFLFTIFTESLHYLILNFRKITKKPLIHNVLADPLIKSGIITFAAILPWLIKIAGEASRLKSSWYYPVDWHLIKSVLGNMFVNYQGTPWYMWKYTAYFSVILILFFITAMLNKKNRSRNLFFLINTLLPLIIVIGISFVKPLFVNRYLISSTVTMVFLIIFALDNIKNEKVKAALGGMFLASVMVFNMWYPARHAKLDIRRTIYEINSLRGKNDLIYAENSLVLFETIYYAGDKNGVYLYNPGKSPFPWYVGEAAYSENLSVSELPVYPQRAFIVEGNGGYHIAYQTSVNGTTNK